MSRKGNIPKRDVLPDPVYGSVAVAKLINGIMLDGKKGTCLLYTSGNHSVKGVGFWQQRRDS